jgi:hypothetical protein
MTKEASLIDMEERVEVVRHRLATFVLRELGCAAVTPLKDDWLDFNLDGPYRFGWMPPVGLLSANELIVISFCPELIAETTAWLDDDALENYLVVIGTYLSAFVADLDADQVEVFRRTQDDLATSCPDALTLVSEVELRALDEGIVQSGSSSLRPED